MLLGDDVHSFDDVPVVVSPVLSGLRALGTTPSSSWTPVLTKKMVEIQQMPTPPCDDVQVLIVGGGPTGLLTAALLDRLGGKCPCNNR